MSTHDTFFDKPRVRHDQVSGVDGQTDLDINTDVTYLDSGGEHAVYNMVPPEWSDRVAKINYASIVELLDGNARAGRPLDTISSEWKRHHEMEVTRRMEEYGELRRYFTHHTLEQVTQIALVPVTNEHIRLLYGPDKVPPAGFEIVELVPTVLTIQEKIPLAELANLTSFHFGSIDLGSLTREDISQMVDNFAYTPSEGADYTAEIERLYPLLKPIIVLVKQDPSNAALVREFAESLIAYTSETGKELDLVGKDNVVFYGEAGLLDYKLLDVIQLEPKLFLKEATLFNEWLHQPHPDTNIAEVVPDNIHFLRGINALAWLSGSVHRLTTVQGQDILPHVRAAVSFLQEQAAV